jgi:DNA-binding response OmpR family regulator
MKKLLVVEDTLHLAEEISDMLRMEGYNVTVGNTGSHALEILEHLRPDLIITDLLMPGIDGFELIERIRKMDWLRTIPIIILSAKTSETDLTRGIAAGADDFILKPCKSHELLASITSLLTKGSS